MTHRKKPLVLELTAALYNEQNKQNINRLAANFSQEQAL